MASKPAKGAFTGKHMLGVMVAGFGIVAAVNFYMASLAVGGFHGIVVENSYVASQKFNDWIDAAKADEALGWEALASRTDDGHVVLTTTGVPGGATIKAELRRPLGAHQYADLTFVPQAEGTYISTEAVSAGRWTMRLSIKANDQDWIEESELR